MIIRLLVALAKGGETFEAGQTVNVDNERAEELIANGYAEEIEVNDVEADVKENGTSGTPSPTDGEADVKEDGEDNTIPPVDENPDNPEQELEEQPQNIPLGRSSSKNGGK